MHHLFRFRHLASASVCALLMLCAPQRLTAQETRPTPPAVPATAAGDPPVAVAVAAMSASRLNSMDVLDDKRRLVVGDRLSLRVIEDEEPPHSLVVTDSGEMEVPYLGRIKASQKTCRELAYELKAQLEREHYYKVTVVVGLDSAGSRVATRGVVNLMGAVRTTGTLPVPAEEVLTVSRAVMKAGGFADFANKKKVRLIRKDPSARNGTRTMYVDLVEVLEKGNISKDLAVEPDDTIFVTENIFQGF